VRESAIFAALREVVSKIAIAREGEQWEEEKKI
jgi:hypothetical protein